jgi:hypothetical protein
MRFGSEKKEGMLSSIDRVFELSAQKLKDINSSYDYSKGSPVYTVKGKYTTRGWTEWTEGFLYGSMILQFDASRDEYFLELAKEKVLSKMALHVSHFGVHDHGFNNVSTYGNLMRLMNEGILPENSWERNFYSMALKQSASIQASRWTQINNGGFIYSFNGPHSLFVDTIRSCRILLLGHKLGHYALGENDLKISLLKRALQHLESTARYSVYYGEGRDLYDVAGRVAHESVFNVNDGNYRCPSSQQGYSPFSTWTRGLAWAILGFSEELEFLNSELISDSSPAEDMHDIEGLIFKAARVCCDFYMEHTPRNGIPYWDTGAPGLSKMGDYLEQEADPFNDHEPVDSSAAAIAAQGFLRLSDYLLKKGKNQESDKYRLYGLGIANRLFHAPYLSEESDHQGLLLHSVYHRPNGWDYIPEGRKIPCGESCMWGDYHALELAVYLKRLLKGEEYYCYFN